MHGPIHYTAREAGAAVKLLVGLPCPKQIKYVLDYGVLSSKESLLSFSLHFSLHSPSCYHWNVLQNELSLFMPKLSM